jgi:putative transposase
MGTPPSHWEGGSCFCSSCEMAHADWLKRYYGRGDLHFLTFSCYQRRDFLATDHARDLFVRELKRVQREYAFRLIGFVVMPNHVHLLISEPIKRTLSTVLQMLKQRVAKKMRERTQITLKRDISEPHAFWQARFYDFNVYSQDKVTEKLNYMHANPVVRKLVGHPGEWVWSSWSNYETGTGMIEVDFV